jgi:very-short-patch-repair endonuclease
MGLHRHATKRKKKFAKKLRRKQTKAERLFWPLCQQLRKEGIVFWRQVVLCGYVVDFWCPKLKLVVEIDGGYHMTEEQQAWDKKREQVMKRSLGAQTIRFTNAEVYTDLKKVDEGLRAKIKTRQAYIKLKSL